MFGVLGSGQWDCQDLTGNSRQDCGPFLHDGSNTSVTQFGFGSFPVEYCNYAQHIYVHIVFTTYETLDESTQYFSDQS